MGVKNAIRYLDARRGKMPFPAVNDTHRAISVMPGDDLFRGIFFYFYLGFASDAESSPYVRRIFSRYDNRIVCLGRTFVVSPLVFFVCRDTCVAYRIASIDPQDKVEGICVSVSWDIRRTDAADIDEAFVPGVDDLSVSGTTQETGRSRDAETVGIIVQLQVRIRDSLGRIVQKGECPVSKTHMIHPSPHL